MSGVACATPVTPYLPSSRLGARLPVGEWLPRADGTSRQKILWCASAQDTPLAVRHKKNGCHPRKFSIRGPQYRPRPYSLLLILRKSLLEPIYLVSKPLGSSLKLSIYLTS